MKVGMRNVQSEVQISLRAARVSSSRSIEEAAEGIKMSPEMLHEYENDSTNIPVSVAVEMLSFYGYHIDQVYFGREKE